MNNSETPEPSSEDSTDQKNQTSKKDGASNKRRAKQARKGGKSETNTSAALVDDPVHAEECSKVLQKLELQHFVVSCDKLEDPSQCEGAPFFCELCEAKLQSVLDCQNHVVTRAHKKAKKSKGEYLVLSRVKSPSNTQISALNKLLDAIFHEHGLCPEKDLPVRQEVANDVSKTVKVMHPECSVSIYGSSLTGFGLKESDVNLDLVIPDESPHVQVSIAEVSTPNKNSYNTCWQVSVPPVLLSILDLLGKDGNYSEVKSEFDAKVPRILFKHVSSGLECELSPGNFSATKTSCLLKKYKDLDSRVQVLAVCLRRWARICSVDCQSEGGLPGYSFALMVIQFLQVIEPPVLPRLVPTEVVDCDSPNLSQDFVTSNKDEIGSLWFQLFRFYCIEFDIPTQVISIQEPVPLMRQDKKWGQKRIAIEDPFAIKRNVASSLGSDKAWEYFFGCWKNSFCYWGSLPSNSQKKPRPEVAKVDKNARTEKKTNDEPLKDTNRKAELANTEEEILEMEYSDLVTKQTVSMEIYDVDGEQKEVSSRVKGEKNLAKLQSTGPSDTEEDIVITLSETESEKSSEVGLQRDVKAAAESKDVAREPHKTKISSAEEIEYKFDPQVFRGNSHPVKTCCFCKKDGHIKENCPDLRKPSLLKLPPMTPEFAAMVDITCRTCRADFEFCKAEEADREQVVKNLEEYIHELYPDAKLHLFGSSKNGFGFRNSDMDICMTLGNRKKEEVDAVEVITELAKLLKKHKDCKTVVPITTAKVPIVKFFLRSCQREADISLYNVLALENTAMLATYAKLDDRVATLGYTVKVFAKVCDIGDASKGSLSSYAYILMMLHYLQQCRPPVIPVLQSLYEEEKQPEKIIDNWNCWFCSDFNKINCLWKPKERNRMSAGHLWLGFLRYYTEVFDFEHDVICCRRTKKLTKFEKMWTKNEFAIEDPFNLDHNLGAGLTRKMAMYITCAFIKGRERFGLPCFIPPQFLQRYFFDVYFLTDGYEAPNDRNCRVCGKIGHFAKDCPLSKSNKRAEQKIEEEERKALQAGAIEESALSTKPFGGGPSRPRSASTATKQRPDSSGVDTTPQPTTEPSNIPPHRSVPATNLSSTEAEPQIGTSPITGGQTAGDRDGNSVNAIGIPPLMHGETIQEKSVEATVEASQQGQANIDPDRSGNSMNAIGIPPLMEVNTIRLMHGKTIQGKSIEATAEASQQEQANIDSNENRTPDALLTVSPPVTTDEHLTSLASPNGSPVRTQMASSLPNIPQNVSPPPGFHMPDGSTQMPYSSNTPRTLASPTPLANRATVGSFDGKPISLQTPPQHHAGILNSPGGHYMGSAAQLWYQQQQFLMMLAHYSPLARPLVPYPPSPDPQTLAYIQMARGHTQSRPIGTSSPPIHGQQQPLEHSLEAMAKSSPIVSRNVMWPAGISSPPPGGREAQFYIPQPLRHGGSPGLPVPTVGSLGQVLHHATQGSFIGTPGANIESPNRSTHGSPQVPGSPQPMPQQLQFPHSPLTLTVNPKSSPPPGGREAQFYIPQQLPRGGSPGLPVPAMGSPGQVMHHATQGSSIGTPGANIESPNHSTHGSPQVTGSPQLTPQQLQFPHSPQTPPGLVSSPRPMPQTPAQFNQSLLQNPVGVHMTGEEFINFIKAVEEESKTAESTTEFIEECETEELEHLPPKDSKLAETPEEHQLWSKLSRVKSLWDGGLPPESEDSVNAVSTEAELLTPQHQTAEPDDELPVKTEAWVGPEKDSDSSQSKCVCSDEKADTSGRNPNCLRSSNGDGYEMSSTTSEQKEEASPVAKRSDVDEKVQSEASGKVEPQGNSTTESAAARAETLEERAKPKRRRNRRSRRTKNVGDTNTPERLEEKGSEDPSRKKNLGEQGGKQANFSDSSTFKTKSAAENPEEKTPNESPRKGKDEKRRPPKTYGDFKDSPNDDDAEKRGAGQLREAQEKFVNSKAVGQVCVQEKQMGKSPSGNQRKGKHPQDTHRRNDDLKAEPLKGSPAAKGQGQSGKGKPRQGESGKGKSRSAERGPVSFPKRSETPPPSNAGGKKEPAGVGRGAGSKGSDTSPRASNKGGRGGNPNRGRRGHGSSNKSSTVGDTRQLRHSTP